MIKKIWKKVLSDNEVSLYLPDNSKGPGRLVLFPGSERNPMEDIYQKYLDNLAVVRSLIKPPVTADMDREQVIGTIHRSAEQLFHIHQENDAILREILFTKTAETLTEREAEQLSLLADELFDFNRSVDVGIAYKIHRLLYAYARRREDVDLAVRELYYQGITIYYLNVYSPDRSTNLFVDKIAEYFEEGAAYLERYEELTSSETRSFIIRCLGNLKFGIRNLHVKTETEDGVNEGWRDYMEIFDRTMAVIQSPHYRQMNPEIPWDTFVYTMHYDRTQFLTELRTRDDPVMAAAVLESAEYVYRNQEHIAREREKNVGLRTQYVYAAARYHAGKATLQELMDALFELCEEANLSDFGGDNIWAVLNAPEYLREYSLHMSEEERLALQPRLRRLFKRQKEFLFRLPQNEYATQVATGVRIIALSGSRQDARFYRHILDYILACHPPTYVHSMVVASLARHLCRRMAQTAPELLAGCFGVKDVEGQLEYLLDQTYRGGLYHDLGKCMLLNYVSLYGRRLLDEEFSCIKLHTLFGCGLLTTLGMKDMSNIAFYHHRSFDGAGGYPDSQEECPSSVRRIVDIITVVDALDAGTDNVGRSYATAKTYAQLLGELRAGRGTRYAPEVVDLLDDPEFCRETEKCLMDSRYQAYLGAYLGAE